MSEKPSKDLFRDTWVRYLGYTNEVGESFRPVIPRKVVHYSYGVAMVYVLADTAHKSFLSLQKDGRSNKMLIEAGDALVWQTLASVIIPGITINRIVHFSSKRLKCKWFAVGIGLASIPVIIYPIDAAVTAIMNKTYRKWF